MGPFGIKVPHPFWFYHWALFSDGGKYQKARFIVCIYTCWNSLTLTATSRVFAQENKMCVASRAFPELVECAGSWPGGACFPAFDCFYNVAKGSLLKGSENNCGRPSPPPHTVYFPHRMLESSELNGTYGTQEKNKRAKYQPTGAGHTAFLPIPEPFSSQVLGLLCSFKIINFKQACSHCCFCYHNFPDIEKREKLKNCTPINLSEKRSEMSPALMFRLS